MHRQKKCCPKQASSQKGIKGGVLSIDCKMSINGRIEFGIVVESFIVSG